MIASEIGRILLSLGWILILLSLLLGALGGVKGSLALSEISKRSLILGGLSLLISTILLAASFVSGDFSIHYVWQFSNLAMPIGYKISAVWGGMDGSMLLWTAMTTMGSVFAINSLLKDSKNLGWGVSALSLSPLFFATVTLFLTNPFRYLDSDIVPPDGNGLNPVLQNTLMAIHPPIMYAGLTLFSIPFAICVGALLSKDYSDSWALRSRKWILIAWGFLTAGITLGGFWAYIELGWGGFWAWDPVENASFHPWLVGTALIHSSLAQERKGMLRMWNLWLAALAYGLTVFGTFLTRSGVVQSVHAFASTDVGWIFLVYLAFIFLLLVFLTIQSKAHLSAKSSIQNLISREAFILINNLILLSICFAVVWGVMFPILSEAVTGAKSTVSAPYFNTITRPLFLLMLLCMGIGPLLAWKNATYKSLKKSLSVPFLSGIFLSILLLFAGIDSLWATLSYGLSWFVSISIMMELHRAVRREAGSSYISSASSVVKRHPSRIGGHIVHLGVSLAAVGITASLFHKIEVETVMREGSKQIVGPYEIELKEFHVNKTPNFEGLQAVSIIRYAATGKELGTLRPESRFYYRNQERTTEIGLLSRPLRDLYVVFAGVDDTGEQAVFKIYINPLQQLLWAGVLIMLLGTLLTLKRRDEKIHV